MTEQIWNNNSNIN